MYTPLFSFFAGTGHPIEKRMIAALLLIVHCMIIPSHDGHMCPCSYVQFVENLAEVVSYAWGAALLAYLYHGMNCYKAKGLKSIKGNTSILVLINQRRGGGLQHGWNMAATTRLSQAEADEDYEEDEDDYYSDDED